MWKGAKRLYMKYNIKQGDTNIEAGHSMSLVKNKGAIVNVKFESMNVKLVWIKQCCR